MRRNLRLAALAGGGLALALGGTAWATYSITAPASDGRIYSCYSTSKGTLRLVGKGTSCVSGERALAWNQAGPQGPAGPTGPAGAPGAKGADGAQGEPGPACPAGSGALRVVRAPQSLQPDPSQPFDVAFADVEPPAGRYVLRGTVDANVDETLSAEAPAADSVGCRVEVGADVLASGTGAAIGYLAESNANMVHAVAHLEIAALGDGDVLEVTDPATQHLRVGCSGPAALVTGVVSPLMVRGAVDLLLLPVADL